VTVAGLNDVFFYLAKVAEKSKKVLDEQAEKHATEKKQLEGE